jgi:hydroxymethylglutaryl-CoA synthase
MAENWREATAKIRFADAMDLTLDLDRAQYEALHDGRQVQGLDYIARNEFVIERVGTVDERHFSDLGIEYYRYIA